MIEQATIDRTDKSKHTTSAFLLALMEFALHIGFFEPFDILEIPIKEVKHTVVAKAQMLICGIALCCGTLLTTYHRLRSEKLVAECLGMEAFPDNTGLCRLLQRVRPADVNDVDLIYAYLMGEHGLAAHSQGFIVIDLDTTGLIVTTKEGRFEWADKGYFARHPGAIGYQLSVVIASNFGNEVLGLILDPGHTNTTFRFLDLAYMAAEQAGGFARLFFRADRQYGVGYILTFLINHQAGGWLIKGRDPRTARAILKRMNNRLVWRYAGHRSWVAEAGLQKVPDCATPVRVVLIRTWNSKERRHEYTYLTTSLPASMGPACELFHFYNGRVVVEKLIERAKNVLQLRHLPTHKFWGLRFFMNLLFLTYNLSLWYHHHVLRELSEFKDMKVPGLMASVGEMHTVVEKMDNEVTFYVANSHPCVETLLQASQTWLQGHSSGTTLGPLVNECYPEVRLFYEIWLHSMTKQGLPIPPPLQPAVFLSSCKG